MIFQRQILMQFFCSLGKFSQLIQGSVTGAQTEPSNEVVIDTKIKSSLELEKEGELGLQESSTQEQELKPSTVVESVCLLDDEGASGGKIIKRLFVQQSESCCQACLKNSQCNSYIHCTRRSGCPTPDGKILFYMQCFLKKNSFHTNHKRQQQQQLGFTSSSLVSGIIPARIPT
eukprot:TRINITY_DN4765_c0_g1_i1.p3 TRINITY_DN4765_c0_g1~~TRINITY_DN4765_c0_g1_i1.p3  ORF type:complete len:174 (-),score=10.82 TRINITY_DN4765_c0_g1_i1:1410-1931(-)